MYAIAYTIVTLKDFTMRKEYMGLELSYLQLLNTISDIKMRELVCHATPEGFMEAPGGAYKHHAYVTGLLEHTVDVCEIAVSMMESNMDDVTQYDVDVMITACLLHDIGKVNEYILHVDGDGNINIAYGDFSIGHVVESVCMMERANGKHGFISQVKLDDVKRVMLAHHGYYEWGTPSSCDVSITRKGEPVASLMQCIIHSADMASAQNDRMPERVRLLLNKE